MKNTERDLAFYVVDSSEEDDRRKNKSAARIYGTEYGDLVDRVEVLLKKNICGA